MKNSKMKGETTDADQGTYLTEVENQRKQDMGRKSKTQAF